MTHWTELKDVAAEANLYSATKEDRWCLMELASVPSFILRSEPEAELRLVSNG